VRHLIGHLAASALVFVTVFTFVWLIQFIVHWLDGMHPFSPATKEFIDGVELTLLYLDAAISLIVVGAGAVRFIRDVMSE